MKMCGFRIFRTFKNHLTIGFSRKYLLKRIGTAVIMLYVPLLNEAKSRYFRSIVNFEIFGFRLPASLL